MDFSLSIFKISEESLLLCILIQRTFINQYSEILYYKMHYPFLDYYPNQPIHQQPLLPQHHQQQYAQLYTPSFLHYHTITTKPHQHSITTKRHQHQITTTHPQKTNQKQLKIKMVVELAQYNLWITQGQLLQEKGDILIVPYETTNLQIYPGSFLRDKLSSSIQKLTELNSKSGDLYLKKESILNYSYIGFIKISGQEPLAGLTIGLNSIFSQMLKKGKWFQSLSVVLDERFQPERLIHMLIHDLRCSLKERMSVNVLVESGQAFRRCINAAISFAQ